MDHETKYHVKIYGPVVMVGYGSIGRGTLPLLKRHIDFDYEKFTVIDPAPLDGNDFIHEKVALTPANYREVLGKYLRRNCGFCINLSVNVCSIDLMKFCRELHVPYIDAGTEPWEGVYADADVGRHLRTNYAFRERVLKEKRESPGGSTAVTCCGANPGMVSWFVKEALMVLAGDTMKSPIIVPTRREEWAQLMKDLGVKGIHIAERDTQVRNRPKAPNTFVNTWSVDGFISEGFQPAELGWGTHEKEMPPDAHTHVEGCKSSIWLDRYGAATRVLTWCPTFGQQHGFLVTHNESVSISDYFTVGNPDQPEYRPTCHYAYHPCDDAVISLHEITGSGRTQEAFHILEADEITSGIDELGVLLYGHEKNALWFGSRLSNEETKRLAPHQNATGLQVTSAILAGIVWAVENPGRGIVDTDEMDYRRCLEIQKPYLGPVEGHYTDWNPLSNVEDSRIGKRSEYDVRERDLEDPWQFKNIIDNW